MDFRFHFATATARLPLRTRQGEIELLPWGRRRTQIGELPLGGWARLDAIEHGQWDRWFPRPVKIMVGRFMEKDFEGQSHWYELTAGQWIQGLLARHRNERRVYIVTINPDMPDAMHDRWPRILSG